MADINENEWQKTLNETRNQSLGELNKKNNEDRKKDIIRNMCLFGFGVIVFVGVFVVCWMNSDQINKGAAYKRAEYCMDEKNYLGAIQELETIDSDYKDTKNFRRKANYYYGIELFGENKYIEARAAFEKAGDFEDSSDYIKKSYYFEGCQLEDSDDFPKIIELFQKSQGYKDSDDKILSTKYKYGCALLTDKKYLEAIDFFKECGDSKDINDKLRETEWQYCCDKNNQSIDNKTFYQFLNELNKDKKYHADVQKCLDDYFGWEVTGIEFFDAPENGDSLSNPSIANAIWCSFVVENKSILPESTHVFAETSYYDENNFITLAYISGYDSAFSQGDSEILGWDKDELLGYFEENADPETRISKEGVVKIVFYNDDDRDNPERKKLGEAELYVTIKKEDIQRVQKKLGTKNLFQ